MEISNTHVLIIVFILFVFLLYKINLLKKETFIAASEPTIAQQINQIYNADVDAIRNLSDIATKLTTGGITLPGNLSITGNLNILPSGLIMAYTGSKDPTGWLICDGRALSTKDYANLFSVIGTQFTKREGFENVAITEQFIGFNFDDFMKQQFERDRALMEANLKNLIEKASKEATAQVAPEQGGIAATNTQTRNYGIAATNTQNQNYTIFNIPNYMGAFLRGTGTGPNTNNVAPALNASRGDAIQNHKHNINDPGHEHGGRTNVVDNFGTRGPLQDVDAAGKSRADYYNSHGYAIRGITVDKAGTGVSVGLMSDGNAAGETRPYNYGVNWIIKI